VEKPAVSPTGRTQEKEKVKTLPRAESPQAPASRDGAPSKNHETQIEKHKPAAAPERESVARPEQKVESSRPATNKPEATVRGEKNAPQRPGRESPAASEKHSQHAADKDKEKIKD
jgi:hypothetical protein